MKPTQEQLNQEARERHAQWIAEYEKVPRETMADIARRHGVSRARVQQIIKRHYAR